MSAIKDKLITAEGLKLVHDTLDEKISSASGGSEYFGVCETLASTEPKVVTVDESFELKDGAVVRVRFNNTNTSYYTRLNVNNTGAKYIRAANTAYIGRDAESSWNNGEVVTFMYDETLSAWMLCSAKTTYCVNNGYSSQFYTPYIAWAWDYDGTNKANRIIVMIDTGGAIIGDPQGMSLYGCLKTYDGENVYYNSGGTIDYVMDNGFGDTFLSFELIARGSKIQVDVSLPAEGDFFCKSDGTPIGVDVPLFLYASVSVSFFS